MKIGLFFGSFNPIHVGHMVIANYMVEFTDLQKIWFVVSPHNPLKEKKSLLFHLHRLALVNEAIGDDDRFKPSDIEFHLSQPSYTANTLAVLYDKYPEHEFGLIMGSDNLSSLSKWKNYEVLLQNHDLYVYPRKADEGGAFRSHPRVKWTEAPMVEISSTFLRKALQEKRDVQHFIPAAAYKYIREMHFYEK